MIQKYPLLDLLKYGLLFQSNFFKPTRKRYWHTIQSVIFTIMNCKKRNGFKIIKLFEDEQGVFHKNCNRCRAVFHFYKAEDYHQNYYNNNTSQRICANL